MDPKAELLNLLSVALTRGQGGFTEEDLALAFKEVFDMLVKGQIGNLVLDGELNLAISNGMVVYSAAKNGNEPDDAVPLEALIENMRSAEGQ